MSRNQSKARSRVGSKRQLPNGRWCVTVSHGYRSDGSRRTLSRVVDTEDEADAAIVALRTELGSSPAAGERMTLDAYFWGVFVPRKEASRTKATVDYYTSAYRTHIAGDFGGMQVNSIPRSAIRTWASTLPAQSAPSYVRALRAVLRSAWEDGLIAQEPMRGRLDLPSRDMRPAPVWTPEQASDALSRLRGEDIEALALVMLGAGLSASEARACDWSSLSPDCREVTVEAAYTQRDGMKGPKNARRYRTVPVLETCAARLRELRGDGPLCVNRRGQRMGPGTVPKRWRALWESGRMGALPFIHMNRLRATHETMMLRVGVPDALNSAIHGHSQKVAYSNYLAPASADAVGAARAANELISPAPRRANLHFVD